MKALKNVTVVKLSLVDCQLGQVIVGYEWVVQEPEIKNGKDLRTILRSQNLQNTEHYTVHSVTL